VTSDTCFELVALRDLSWDGALNFAPGRWLLPDPTPQVLEALREPVASGTAALVDVSGKWQRISVKGAGAAAILHRAVALETVLAGRDCAALRLFDCPSVLARAQDGFDIWVEASYAGALRASLETARKHSTAA
jgi:heterotetrameric sarcosine oxidase gamma subunit